MRTCPVCPSPFSSPVLRLIADMHEDWYSGPSPTWQFPNGTLFKKWEGEVITVGEKQFLITRDIHESFWQGVEQWKVVFEGIDLQTSEPVVIKIRYV